MDIDKAQGDEETDDMATSKAGTPFPILNLFYRLDWLSSELLRLIFVVAPRDIIELPDDEEEEVPLMERRRGRASSGKTTEGQVPQSTSVTETMVQQSRDLARANVSFANPLSTDHPSASTTQVSIAPAQLHNSDPVVTPTVPHRRSLMCTTLQMIRRVPPERLYSKQTS